MHIWKQGYASLSGAWGHGSICIERLSCRSVNVLACHNARWVTHSITRGSGLHTIFTHHLHPGDHTHPLLCTDACAGHQWSGMEWSKRRAAPKRAPGATKDPQKATRGPLVISISKLEGNFAHCLRRKPPSDQSPAGSARTSPRPYHLSPGSPGSVFSYIISYSGSKQGIVSRSSPHTFSLFQWPVQTFHAFTGNHPELGISVPVVFGGSCGSSVGVTNEALLCVVKTSVPTRHCSTLIWGRKGKGGRGVGHIVHLPLVIIKRRASDLRAPSHPLSHLIKLQAHVNTPWHFISHAAVMIIVTESW